MKRTKLILTCGGNLFANLACTVALFAATAPVNFQLILNWLSRASTAGMPRRSIEVEMAKLAELRATSSYAEFITDCHILVTTVILIAEALLTAWLVWLAWQNFRKLVWALCK